MHFVDGWKSPEAELMCSAFRNWILAVQSLAVIVLTDLIQLSHMKYFWEDASNNVNNETMCSSRMEIILVVILYLIRAVYNSCSNCMECDSLNFSSFTYIFVYLFLYIFN